jgi:hypothetical protein
MAISPVAVDNFVVNFELVGFEARLTYEQGLLTK